MAQSTSSPQDSSKQDTNVASIASKFSEAALLDMVFVMDATGSMGSYISAAQQAIRDIVQQIVSTEKADVRFALVSYRDHPPQEKSYVTTVFPFSSSVSTMRKNLDTLSASGGGDGPEAVVDGLHAALKLDYRGDATKVCILIADAPPHGLGSHGDGFPEGCPCGLDPITVCKSMAEHGITLYCIGCEPALAACKSFFVALAHITGGQYCPLGNAATLCSAVVSGMREEISLERLMGDVRSHIEQCADMSEEQQARFVQEKLQERGVRAQHLSHDGKATELTEDAIAMSKADSLASARKFYSPSAESHGSFWTPSMPVAGFGAPAPAPGFAAPTPPPFFAAPTPAPGFFSSTLRMMGFGGEAPSAPPPLPVLSSASPMFASAAPAMTSAYGSSEALPTSYSVKEDAVSMEQCSRMVQKSKARKY